MKARVRILCGESGRQRYRTYTVPVAAGDKVLGTLLHLFERLDPRLSFRFNCRGRHCGECAMMINGRPALACATPVSRELVLEPLANLPLVKDLVVDRGEVYRRIIGRVPPAVGEAQGDRASVRPRLREVRPDLIDRVVALDDCIECLCCMAVCPAWEGEKEAFPGPLGLLALAVAAEQGGLVTAVSPEVEKCVACGRCESVCPRRIPILTRGIARLKKG